jgi:hypothetical protein
LAVVCCVLVLAKAGARQAQGSTASFAGAGSQLSEAARSAAAKKNSVRQRAVQLPKKLSEAEAHDASSDEGSGRPGQRASASELSQSLKAFCSFV